MNFPKVPDRIPVTDTSKGILGLHHKTSHFLWRWKWWLTGLSGLLMLIIMNSASITTTSGIVTSDDRFTRLWIAIALGMLTAMLVAWLIGAIHSLLHRHVKWFVGLMILPPVALIYLYLY